MGEEERGGPGEVLEAHPGALKVWGRGPSASEIGLHTVEPE